MATLPSPDPERYSDVHMLRRAGTCRKIQLPPMDEIEAGQADWERKFAAGDADANSYRERAKALESEIEKELEGRTGTGGMLGKLRAVQKWRTFETAAHERELAETKRELGQARSRADLWRGIVLTLAVIFLLGVMSECANRGHYWLNQYERVNP
jgi:hypothetical protein